MGYSFGERSEKNLSECVEPLQRVIRRALSYGVMDFSVTEGHRDTDEQYKLFLDGKSTIDGKSRKGKHNFMPSKAADLMPYPPVLNGVNVWNDKQRFCVLAGVIYAAAAEEGVKIRWGGDWDGDGNNADSTFHDLPHIEILG